MARDVAPGVLHEAALSPKLNRCHDVSKDICVRQLIAIRQFLLDVSIFMPYS